MADDFGREVLDKLPGRGTEVSDLAVILSAQFSSRIEPDRLLLMLNGRIALPSAYRDVIYSALDLDLP